MRTELEIEEQFEVCWKVYNEAVAELCEAEQFTCPVKFLWLKEVADRLSSVCSALAWVIDNNSQQTGPAAARLSLNEIPDYISELVVEMNPLVQTPWQKSLMIKVLKKHLGLRKSHFVECTNGLKREKIGDELVVIKGWLTQLGEEV